MAASERALTGCLNQIVSLDGGPRQPTREAPKPRQRRDQLVAEPAPVRILVCAQSC